MGWNLVPGGGRVAWVAVVAAVLVVSLWQEVQGQTVAAPPVERYDGADGPTVGESGRSYELTDVAMASERGSRGNDDVSLPIELAPYVISASRYDEDILKAPASISVVSSGRLELEGGPSVVATLRTVPGVDVQQAGLNRYLVAVRGFNNAFASNTYVLVDHREAYNPALALVAYEQLPVDALDIDRIEVVRGPGSALYGPGVEQGVIHFLTKDPFTYPGTSVAVGLGNQSMRQGAFRHAGVIKDKLGYKITGSFLQGEDWKLDRADLLHDAQILEAIVPEKKDIDGNVARIVEGRDYDIYALNLSGELHYRFDDEIRLTAFVGYSTGEYILNASLGEIQVDGPSLLTAQVRLERGPFSAQAYGVREFVDGDNFFYRADHLMYGQSSEINLQAQYKLVWSESEEPIVIGADYKRTAPKSQGTIFGRFENEDNFSNAGGYLQAAKAVTDRLDFRASGRLDHLGATDDTVFSPRLALVYQSNPEHTFRLTYNRALSRPIASDYYGDLQVGREDAFLIRFLGGARGITFPDPPETSSFVGPGRDPGVRMATARAYAALTEGVAAQFQPDDPGPFRDLLVSRTPAIGGISEGIMTFRSTTGDLLGEVEALQGTETMRSPLTDTVEVGYKGVWGERFLVGLDGYYARKKDMIFARVITPFVEIPDETLGTDLGKAVQAAFTDAELAPFGIDVEALASGYAAASAALADMPIGIMEPEQNYDPDTLPEMVMANLNAGSLDYFGVDLSFEAYLGDRWTAYANYSWVSENYFDAEALGLPGSGSVISMNAPKHKVRAGVVYKTARGLTLSCGVRYVDSFAVADGVNYNGIVESYTLVDAGLSYEFGLGDTRMRFTLTAQNLLDKLHREYIGFPKIGRLVTSRLTCEF